MTKKLSPLLVLFRQDLRITDNPALFYACKTSRPIIPLYILDEKSPGKWKMGAASNAWLHFSLKKLNESLIEKGSRLFLYKGETLKIVQSLIERYNVRAIFWNHAYEPYWIKVEKKFKELLPLSEGFKGSLLFEPTDIINKQGEPFKIFTPFWRRCLEVLEIKAPLPAPITIHTENIMGEELNSWKLLKSYPENLESSTIGEKAAQVKLEYFLKNSLKSYANDRDIPSLDCTSKLSPHLHFGEISPGQVIYCAQHNAKFLSEIGWREFCYYQLFHFPELPEKPWRSEYAHFPWEKNANFLEKWQQGQTGYPLVDAGMRELRTTGIMHNRVRMITASFLIKDLFIHWKTGAEWFWQTLVDADLANNSASWQWVAGCGFDAAPFFRIFNPILQSKKFDPEGSYIKKFVPELAHLPKAFIHQPWDKAPDYARPLVNHEEARKKALNSFKLLRKRAL